MWERIDTICVTVMSELTMRSGIIDREVSSENGCRILVIRYRKTRGVSYGSHMAPYEQVQVFEWRINYNNLSGLFTFLFILKKTRYVTKHMMVWIIAMKV